MIIENYLTFIMIFHYMIVIKCKIYKKMIFNINLQNAKLHCYERQHLKTVVFINYNIINLNLNKKN